MQLSADTLLSRYCGQSWSSNSVSALIPYAFSVKACAQKLTYILFDNINHRVLWFAKDHNGCFYLHILDRQEVEDGLYDSFENTVDEGLDPVLEHNNATSASAQCHDDAHPEEVVHQAGEGVEDPAQAAQPAHPHVYPAQAADLQTW